MESALLALQQSIELAKGVLKVTMIDPEGNTLEVLNGKTIEFFAGFYKDQIKDTTGGTVVYNEGEIITKQYVMSIENTSQTPLELISTLYGGSGEPATISAPNAFPSSDYHQNRRYDVTSLSVTQISTAETGDFKQIAGTQSSQVKSQWGYSRYKNFGFNQQLYAYNPVEIDDSSQVPPWTYDTSLSPYIYNGQGLPDPFNIGFSPIVPFHWGHFLPFDPAYNIGAAEANVWIGTNNGSSVPDGNGDLSEFCIHVDHPLLPGLGAGFDISTGTSLVGYVQTGFCRYFHTGNDR